MDNTTLPHNVKSHHSKQSGPKAESKLKRYKGKYLMKIIYLL